MYSGGVCPIQQHIFQIQPKRTTLNQNFYDKNRGKKVVIVMIISILENEYIRFELWNDFIGYW